MSDVSSPNAASLRREVEWFSTFLSARFSHHFEPDKSSADIDGIVPPDLESDTSEFAQFVKRHDMRVDERIVFILALIPHVRPQALDVLFTRSELDRAFTEFGGRVGKAHGGFLPTLETAAFVLAGTDLAQRFEIMRLFHRDHFFTRNDVLRFEHSGSREPFFSAALSVSQDTLNLVTSGISHRPDYGIEFPAKLTTTRLEWDDLVLPPAVLEDVEKIKTWILHSNEILEGWGLQRTVKPGYRCLFHGPPGTGKTLTATLIGADVGADVYRIDLSMLVSKYIGETEKNLANVFDQAENKNWILFFDEADALFGKRTQTTSGNDRFANQQISYLLQRVEDAPGVVILATNLKANIDAAFARRFQSMIYFPMPDIAQRRALWEGVFRDECPRADDVKLDDLAEQFELSGGAITNVVRYAAINAFHDGQREIRRADLVAGIRRELQKEGRTPR